MDISGFLKLFAGDSCLAGFWWLTCAAAPAALAELGLYLSDGLDCGRTGLLAVGAVGFEEVPPISSITSVSISFKFDFQHITIVSLPEVVKKSPFGEKSTSLAAPSCPYRLYKM